MDFVVMRGDRRQNLLCDLLIADGHRAQLLPEPEKWGRENLLPPGAFLVTAKASDALKEAALKYGFRLIEYGNIPSFVEENGAITAEGALQIAMRHRLRTLRGSDVLVIGYGGIGKPLSAMLKSLGADVSVAVRREEQLWILKGEGYRPILSKDLLQFAGEYDVIFNTAPQLLLTRPVLEQMSPGVLIVDLASRPGGVDWKTAREMELKAVHALALPGQLTPVSGAIAIQHAIYQICEEAYHAR
jgi:dipicolinate synthase subunit A